jgi:hypothetical protein
VKSESWLIIQFATVLFILGLLSFFRVPAYEKGAWFVMGAFSAGFTAILGYKFGKSMPQQAGDARPGQASQSETTTTISTGPPPADAPKP